MEGSRKIMYVGLQLKAPSVDRPNNRPDRVWNGPGDVVEGIPPIQAGALTVHKEEWRDVTSLSDKDLLAAQQAARAESERRVREMHNPVDAPSNARNIDSVSDADLEEEIERRRRARSTIAAGAHQRVLVDDEGDGIATVKKSDAQLVELAAAAVESIVNRCATKPDLKAELLTEEGLPTLAALQETLGFPITEDEYRVALGMDEPRT